MEADPDQIIAKARGDHSAKRDSDAKNFLSQIQALQKSGVSKFNSTISPITSGTGFALPMGVGDDRPSLEFKKKVQEEVKLQMEIKRKMLEEYANTELEIEKNIVRDDNERAQLDNDTRLKRKLNMAMTLREHLIQQAKLKESNKQQLRDSNVFKYQFPFEDGGEKPFLISPTKAQKDMNRTISVDMHKELPL